LFCLISEAVLVVMSAVAVALTPLVTRLSGMAPENAAFTLRLMIFIAAYKSVLWVTAFTLPNAMRAAGDVRFSATVSALSMWIFRVGGSVVLCRVFHMGLYGVWTSWGLDWLCRTVIYLVRYFRGSWENKTVITG
ncbi:MAG: hypothetical protein PUB51_07375, partial [Oscillospiraceae bacterium]|nr:hypothetical protein [Oscillospiraceae bacterium]